MCGSHNEVSALDCDERTISNPVIIPPSDGGDKKAIDSPISLVPFKAMELKSDTNPVEKCHPQREQQQLFGGYFCSLDKGNISDHPAAAANRPCITLDWAI